MMRISGLGRHKAWCALTLAGGLLLGACSGGMEAEDAGSETDIPARNVERHLADYFSVMRQLHAEQGCPPAPMLCAPGAPSGSPEDAGLHAWLAEALDALPAMRDIATHRFAIPSFEVQRASIEIPDRLAPTVMPLHYSGVTPGGGVEGPLLDVGGDGLLDFLLPANVAGRIVMLEGERFVHGESASLRRKLARLEADGAIGAVVSIPEAPNNLIMAHNRDSRDPTGTLPTLVISSHDAEALRAHAGATARLTLEADSRPASAEAAFGRNTSGWLPGHDSSRWLVIGTPVNSWLLAGAERGPGIAVFLGLADHLAERVQREGPLPYPVYFVATGGHEIFQLGLQRFFACTEAEHIGAYVHAGSGLVSRGHRGASSGAPEPRDGLTHTRMLNVSENPMLRALVNPAFSEPGVQPLLDVSPAVFRPGESRVAWQLGIPLLGITGSNAYHHTAGDDESQIIHQALPAMLRAFRETVDGLLDSNLTALQAAEIGADLRQPLEPALPCAGPPAGFVD